MQLGTNFNLKLKITVKKLCLYIFRFFGYRIDYLRGTLF